MWVFQIVCLSSTAPHRCWCAATWVPWQNHQWFSLVNDHRCLSVWGLVPALNRFLMSLSSGLHWIKEKWVDECLPIWFLVCNSSSIEWEQSPLCSWFLVWASLTWLWTLPNQNFKLICLSIYIWTVSSCKLFLSTSWALEHNPNAELSSRTCWLRLTAT